MSKVEEFYDKHYKKLIIIPVLLFAISLGIIGNFYAKNGDIIDKDVSLKGGVSASIYADSNKELNEIENNLENKLGNKVTARRLVNIESTKSGFLIEGENLEADALREALEEELGVQLNEENFFFEETGNKIGQDFYLDMIKALITAFVLMSIVILITYRKLIPTITLILSIILDLTVTIAILDLIGIRVTSAGISSLLLLIGYAVDNDVLLTTKLIKRKEENVWMSMIGAAKTGFTMTLATIVAVFIGFVFSKPLILKEVFLIIFIGTLVDLISSYIMSTGILKWYLSRKNEN